MLQYIKYMEMVYIGHLSVKGTNLKDIKICAELEDREDGLNFMIHRMYV